MNKILLFITLYSLVVGLTRLDPPAGILSENAGPECGENYITSLYNTTTEILEEFYKSTGGDFWISGSDTWTNRSLSFCLWGGITCDMSCDVTSLSVRENNLTGTIPKSIGRLIKIRVIDLSYNHLVGGLETIGQLPKIRKIFMEENSLYETLPNITSQGLTDINLLNNLIYGNLRSDYSVLPLRTFIVSINQLSGTIPKEWYNLKQLQSINLSNNSLEGEIPDIFSDAIVAIDLSNNKFTGLPVLSGYYPQLTQIYINNNELRGTIPLTWISLTSLEILHIDNNHLYGEFSYMLKSYSKIRDVRIFNNNFSGLLPEWYFNYNLITFYASYNNFSGYIHPPFERLSYLDLRNNPLLSNGNILYDNFGFFPTKFGTIYDNVLCPVLTNNNNLILVVSPEYYQYKFCNSIL